MLKRKILFKTINKGYPAVKPEGKQDFNWFNYYSAKIINNFLDNLIR